MMMTMMMNMPLSSSSSRATTKRKAALAALLLVFILQSNGGGTRRRNRFVEASAAAPSAGAGKQAQVASAASSVSTAIASSSLSGPSSKAATEVEEEEKPGKSDDKKRGFGFFQLNLFPPAKKEGNGTITTSGSEEDGATNSGRRGRRRRDRRDRNGTSVADKDAPKKSKKREPKKQSDEEGRNRRAGREEGSGGGLFPNPFGRRGLFGSKKDGGEAAKEEPSSPPAEAAADAKNKTAGAAAEEQQPTKQKEDTGGRSAPDSDAPEESKLGTEEDSSGQQLNATATTAAASANATAASEAQQQQQPSQPPPGSPSSVIVIGPHGPQRVYRRPVAAGVPVGSSLAEQQKYAQQQQQQQALSQNGLLLIELAASVLGTFTRLWLLRWVTTWLARQEESIQPTQHFVFERLNDRYTRDEAALKTVVEAPPDGVSQGTWRRDRARSLGRPPAFRPDPSAMFHRTVVVVELKTDSKDGPDNDFLSDAISFLLQQHRRHAFGTRKLEEGGGGGLGGGGNGKKTKTRNVPGGDGPLELEVVFLVQSPGGSVASFGLTAAQIRRLSGEPGIVTTACVDKYAASGGYMIASQAHKLLASPFATVGSIGVIMEGLNFNEVAKKYGIQPLVIKAGESKNPLSTFGSVSRHDLEQEKQRLEKVHNAFKDLIVYGRPVLNETIQDIADGSVFLGSEAQPLNLVDRVTTSSEYILERVQGGDRVLQLHRTSPSRFQRRVAIHPLDILPHLRSWVTARLSKLGNSIFHQQHFDAEGNHSPSVTLLRLIQVGTVLGSFITYATNTLLQTGRTVDEDGR